jgi:hypothetical protein
MNRYLLYRLIALALPVLITAGGLLQTSHARFDFSSTAPLVSKVPVWVISVDELMLSAPFIFVGLWGVVNVLRRTGRRLRIDYFHMGLGLAGVVPTAFILFLTRGGGDTAFSYRMIFNDGTTAGLSLVTTLIGAVAWVGITWGFLMLYTQGLVSEGSGKYDRRADEPDAMGALISEMDRS